MPREEQPRFLTLEDGQTATVTIDEEGRKEYQHYDQGKMVRCAGKRCDLCAEGDQARLSYVLPIILKRTPYLLRLSKTHYEAIAQARQDDLEGALIRITRNRTREGVRYQVSVLNPIDGEDGEDDEKGQEPFGRAPARATAARSQGTPEPTPERRQGAPVPFEPEGEEPEEEEESGWQAHTTVLLELLLATLDTIQATLGRIETKKVPFEP